MSEIPEDIMRAVQSAWGKAWGKTGSTNAESIRDAIAIAIIEERERGQLIADAGWNDMSSPPPNKLHALGYNAKLNVPAFVFWMDDKMDGTGTYPCILGIGELYGKLYEIAGPTHWRPLPVPPLSTSTITNPDSAPTPPE